MRLLLYEELGDNIAYSDRWDYGDVDGAFAAADRVVRETFRQHRHANVPMETHGGLATYAPATGSWSTTPPTRRPTPCASSCPSCSAIPNIAST